MMNLKILAIATACTAAMASPALAMGPHARSEAVQQRLQQSRMYHHTYRYDGFGPAEAAAGVVGGALGVAGAIAGAPYGYDGYDTYYGGPSPYAW
jgi:hypothetical protein